MFQNTITSAKYHIKSNKYTYLSLFLFYIIGIVAGSMAVNQLDYQQRGEMTNYFNGFLKLLNGSEINGLALFKISLLDNLKVILLLWFLGLTVIGIPVFYLVIGMRGFCTGFSSGVIMSVLGFKGILISVVCFLPKEVIILPCLIVIAVNGIKFSKSIFMNWVKRSVRIEDRFRNRIVPYSFGTVFFSIFIFVTTLLEAFFSPGALKILSTIY